MQIDFKGKIYQIKSEQVNGKHFEYAQRAPGTRIIIDNGKEILLTKEFRREQNTYDYRIPGGKVFDTLQELNNFTGDMLEKAKEGAIREVKEETGIVIKSLDLLKLSKCGATVIWDLYYFVSKEFEITKNSQKEEDEDISEGWYTYSEVIDMCKKGLVNEDRTLGILLKYLLNK